MHPDEALVEASEQAVPPAAATPGPSPSSDAPEPVQEPLRQPGSDEQPLTEDHPREFDARCKEPFTGLLYLGYLEDSFVIWGHQFRIATPSQMEKIQAGALHAPYVNTLASDIAYQTILVATYLISVDRNELPRPVLTDPKENAVRDRFEWVAENLRPPVIDQLFSRCMILEGEVGKTLRAMGEARG